MMIVKPKLIIFAKSKMLKVNARRVERFKIVNGKITWKMMFLPAVPIILALKA